MGSNESSVSWEIFLFDSAISPRIAWRLGDIQESYILIWLSIWNWTSEFKTNLCICSGLSVSDGWRGLNYISIYFWNKNMLSYSLLIAATGQSSLLFPSSRVSENCSEECDLQMHWLFWSKEIWSYLFFEHLAMSIKKHEMWQQIQVDWPAWCNRWTLRMQWSDRSQRLPESSRGSSRDLRSKITFDDLNDKLTKAEEVGEWSDGDRGTGVTHYEGYSEEWFSLEGNVIASNVTFVLYS